MERKLFERAVLGFDHSSSDLDDDKMAHLEAAVDAYRSLLQRFMQTEAAEACMKVELKSRELLVVWVAYCLMHASARRQHPSIMAGFCVALDWQDLRHLVLSDKDAVDAMLSVSAYLHKHSVSNRPLFSLRDGGEATMAMALP